VYAIWLGSTNKMLVSIYTFNCNYIWYLIMYRTYEMRRLNDLLKVVEREIVQKDSVVL